MGRSLRSYCSSAACAIVAAMRRGQQCRCYQPAGSGGGGGSGTRRIWSWPQWIASMSLSSCSFLQRRYGAARRADGAPRWARLHVARPHPCMLTATHLRQQKRDARFRWAPGPATSPTRPNAIKRAAGDVIKAPLLKRVGCNAASPASATTTCPFAGSRPPHLVLRCWCTSQV